VLALEHGGLTPQRGDILVTGAKGGVGSIAIAILSDRGSRVVASTGRLDEGDDLCSLGAAEIIERRTLAEPGAPIARERAAPGKFESKRCCSNTGVSVQSQGIRWRFRNFRSSLDERVPLCGHCNANFLILLCPLERRCSSRRKRPGSSAVPKPCATSSQGSASKRSPTRGTLPILPCVHGSTALPTKAPRVWWIARTPVDRPQSPAPWQTISIASSIKTPWSTARSIPNGVVANSRPSSPAKLGSNSAAKVCAVC